MTKKRICIDISNVIPGKGGSGGGIATYSLNLLKGLNRNKEIDQFEIICFKHPDFFGFEECRNIAFIDIKIKNKKFFNRLYWTHVYLPFFCIKHKIDLLHRVTPELPAVKVCKYVCTLHDLMFDFYLAHPEISKFLSKSEFIKYRLLQFVTRKATKISDCVIVPTNTIKEELISNYNFKEDKILVTYLATEPVCKNKLEASGKEKNEKIRIGVIAGFYPHKGHEKVMALANKFINSGYTNFKIYFRGNPAFPAYIKEMLLIKEQLHLQEYIETIPYEKRSTLAEIYSSFDIILTLSQNEGFGLPVLEAQSYNIPVFCSDIKVFREVLSDSAFFVKNDLSENDIEEIRKHMNDYEFLATLVAKGKNNLAKYSWEKMSSETIQMFSAL